jgi:uncharacterized membrane protein YgcG
VDIDVLSVTCNGENETYSTKLSGNDIEIRIGNADVLLKPGEYEYAITYSSRGHIGFFDGYDELYWNVTGFSDFVIEQASATVTLPDGATALKTYAYTGEKGAKGKDYGVEDRGNVQVFTVTRPFAPNEGLTVSVAFPSGIIERTPQSESLSAGDESSSGVAFLFFLATCGLLALLYFPSKRAVSGVVFPQFTAPNNMSPGAVNYLYRQKYENKAFTADILQFAVKGALLISKIKRSYKLDNTSDVSRLSDEELIIHSRLFKDQEQIDLRSSSDDLCGTKCLHETNIEKAYNIENYYRKRTKQIFLGLAVIILLPSLYMYLIEDLEGIFFSGAATFWFLIMSFFAAYAKSKHKIPFWTVCCSILGILFFFGMLSQSYENNFYFNGATNLYLVASGLLYTRFAYNLFLPTKKSAQVIADIKGLRMYMKVAEQHRLNILNPPDQTPVHFEKLLPYAIALNVANEWCKRFAAVLKVANYQPAWSADTFDNHSWSSFNSSFAQSFNSSVSNSSTSSSGSSDWGSGSSGGGSSGGGGGGGRTRGW